MSESSQAEQPEEFLGPASPPQAIENICSAGVEGLGNVTCINARGTKNICGQSEENCESSAVNVGDSGFGSCPERKSSVLELCGAIEKAKERSGRGGEEVPCKQCHGAGDGKWATPRGSQGGPCDSLSFTVSEVVTAFQEVKSEFKNAVKDAHCEFVSTVSELSHALTGSNQCSAGTDQQNVESAPKDKEGNILVSPLYKSSETVIENLESNDRSIECLSSDLDNLTLQPKTQSESVSDGHKQHLLLESYDSVKSKPEFHYSVGHRTDIAMDVNLYRRENEVLTANGTRDTLNTQTVEPNENKVVSTPQVAAHIQNNNLFKVDTGIIQGDARCTKVDDDDDLAQRKGRSGHLSTCIEETGARAQPTSAPTTPVPSATGSVRKILRSQGCQGRRVSFPEDDTRLISSYLEPVNPWQQMAGVTVEEIAAAYRSSCERHGTQPLPGVLQQIKALPLVVGGRIECISLRGQRLEGGQCEGLEEIFRRVQFKILDLEGCALEDDTAIPLFDMIEFYDSATQLNISCNSRIGFRGWQACARMLKRTPSVEYLDARNTNLNETNMPILGRALRLGARLHTLHLENCNLSGRPLIMLTAALKQNDTLAELYLAENRLGVTDCIQLGNLARANSTLRVLDLRNNNVQDAGCGHVCEGICEQQKLQHEKQEKESNSGDAKKTIKGLNSLVLWNNHLTQQSAPHLAGLLSGSTTLEMVNLGRNNLTSEGILRLKESLLRNRSLLRLGLQAARIADEGAVALAEYTADNVVIQQIDLRENPIRVAGLMALAHSLRLNTTITQMDLDSDPRTEPAVELAEQHSALQKEIKEYCQRNLTRTHLQGSQNPSRCSFQGSIPEVPALDKLTVNSAFRKVSLTCETSNRIAQLDTRIDSPGREEEKQKYISPAPSPLPSPAPSPCASPSPSPVPSPLKNRFRVFRVQEACRSTSQSPLNTTNHTSTVCSSAPVSQCGRSMSAGDLNLPSKQPSVRPNRFSTGGRFTVTRVTEVSGSCSLPSSHMPSCSITTTVPATGTVSSPKIVISSPVRVERGFSIEETTMASRQNPFFLEKNGDIVTTSSSTHCINDKFNCCLPEGHQKTPACLSGHIVRLKSDSDSDDVFVDAANSNSSGGWSDSASQRGGAYLRSSVNDSSSSSAEKDTDSVSSSELTDSGFLDDSACGVGKVGGSCSPSPSSPHPEGDLDSLLSSSVDSTSQEDNGLGSSISISNSQTSPLPSSVPLLPCTAQPSVHPAVAEPLKRAPLAAMENGSFDSDSEDSEVTTQSSDSTHSDEIRITTEQFAPRPAWGLKQETIEEVHHGAEALYASPETPGSG